MSRTASPFLFLTCWLCHYSQGKLLRGDTAHRRQLSNPHPFMMDGHRHGCCVLLQLRMVPGDCLQLLSSLGLPSIVGREVLNLSEMNEQRGRFYPHNTNTKKDVDRHQDICFSLSLTCYGLHCTFNVPPKHMHLPPWRMKPVLMSDLLNATWVSASAPNHPFLCI